MAQTTISIRMDEALKKDFDSVCDELGITMSTAVVILAKKMSREKRIPFDVSIDPNYNAETLAAMKESEDILSGKLPSKGYASAQALFAEVDQETEEYA